MKYAYVTLLYGNNIYITGALVLGYSLIETNTNYDRVILVTNDVDEESRVLLSKVYNQVIQVDYIPAHESIFYYTTSRFKEIFTKLEILSLAQYDKILWLDTDIIVMKNIDQLFKLKPPAAVVKHYYVAYGKKIPSKLICQDNKLTHGINAGVILLKPDEKELDLIKQDIIKEQKESFKAPEQDYLSVRYCQDWTSITFNFNFQFGLTGRVEKTKYNLSNVYVLHYSSEVKPWNFLDKNHEADEKELAFIETHKNYYALWIQYYEKTKQYLAKYKLEIPYSYLKDSTGGKPGKKKEPPVTITNISGPVRILVITIKRQILR